MEEEQLRELVFKSQSGDLLAFEQLVKSYESELFRFISRHVPRDEVETIAQESFLAVFKALRTLNTPELFKSWLKGIAIRKSRDFWRMEYRRRKKQSVELEAIPSKPDDTVLAHEILNSVSADERVLLTLLYLEEYSVKEVAELLHLTEVGVKVRAHRLKKRIQRGMAK